MDIKKITEVLQIIKKNHFQAYVVGGTARDIILKRDFSDVDIATNAPIDFIKKSFKIENDDGLAFGSIKIVYKNIIMEITRFRQEKYNDNSNFPVIEKYLNKPIEEASRRDFTINCLYLDLTNNEIVDPYNGLNDLLQARLNFIGDPYIRIKEDPSRIIRGLRLAYKLNFIIDETTKKAFIECHDEIKKISNTKLKRELGKMVSDLGLDKTINILKTYQIDSRGVLNNENQ